MYNKLWMNPGYAGSADVACVQAIARNQWIGFDGAPKSQSANFHTPLFGNRVGMGLSVNHDQLGPTDAWTGSMNYSYRIHTNKGRLAVGLQASLTSMSINYNRLIALEDGDGELPVARLSKSLPNFGAGAYYSTDNYYLGLSVPFILRNDLSFAEGNSTDISGRQEMHWYIMGGLLKRLSDNVQIKPAVLAKFAHNSPFDLDANISLIFLEKVWAGVSYRLGGEQGGVGESVDFILQYQLSNGIRVGAAYDWTLSDLRDYNDGSVEFLMQYCISNDHQKLTNPRFF